MKWKTAKLRDITTFIKRGVSPKYVDTGGVLVINQKCIRNNRLNIEFARLTDIQKKIPTDRLCVKGDILINSTGTGTLGRTAKFNRLDIKCTVDTHVTIVRANPSVDSTFLSFIIGLMEPVIEGMAKGATNQVELSASDLGELNISLPPLSTQRRIASILSAYDDLIENNLRRIKLLEEAARCEYKMLMEESYNSPRVAIKEVLEYYIGGGWGNDSYTSDFCKPAFVIRGTDIPNNKIGNISNTPYRFHKESNLTSRNLKSGDIVFEVSGGSKTSPIGRALLISDKLLDLFNAEVMCASFCKLMRPNDKITSEYLYLFLSESYNDRSLKPYERPSASNIINFGFETYIEEATILLPEEETLREFTIKVHNYLQMIAVIGAQNTQLRQARELLLPKLMSGEIDVEEISGTTYIEDESFEGSMAAEDEVVYQQTNK